MSKGSLQKEDETYATIWCLWETTSSNLVGVV